MPTRSVSKGEKKTRSVCIIPGRIMGGQKEESLGKAVREDDIFTYTDSLITGPVL